MFKQPVQKKQWVMPSFLQEIRNLPFGRQVVLFASFIAFISLFFPWFYEGTRWFNGYEKISVFGILLTCFSLISFYIILREAFFRKGYLLGFSHYKILLFLLSLGLYTVILYTFSLYELLNYSQSSNSDVGIGGMFQFVSFGVALGGLLFSQSFFPKPKKIQLMNTPEKVDVSNSSLSIEKQHLFQNND